IIATDLSAAQLHQAKPDPRISYRVAVAEDSGLPAAYFDLVSVAQALHWFDCERFYAEVRRVLRPGGLLAVWCYGVCSLDYQRGDADLQTFYRDVVGPYWPAERRHVESAYQTLPFPAPELAVPALAITQQWSLAELTGYVSSWSATGAYIKARGEDPVPALRAAMASHWGDEQDRHEIRWPLAVRAALLNRP
ncbi:MAG TPA: class I SAM-dependent methyltransferase, partial [Steroidobacteraceae bacterium]